MQVTPSMAYEEGTLAERSELAPAITAALMMPRSMAGAAMMLLTAGEAAGDRCRVRPLGSSAS